MILVAGYLLGFTSVMLRQNKTLGLVAALLAGSRVPVNGKVHNDYYLGLD